jgi:hypothetical protein
MTIQQLVDLAVDGELRTLQVKDNTASIVGYINLGLIELYKRFPLDVQEHMITLLDGVEIYTMPSNFMWIVSAYDEVPETSNLTVLPIPINEEDNPVSINTISWNQVQVPVTVTGAYISIIYVAAPTYFTDADLATTLPIPPQMVEALLHYIGYRAHGSDDGNVQAENSTHYQRFELSCKRIEQMGMFTPDDLSMTSRNIKGFV